MNRKTGEFYVQLQGINKFFYTIPRRFNYEKKIGYKSKEIIYPAFHQWAGIGYMYREDFGLTATAGIHFKRLLFSVDYGYGLKNITRPERIVEDENKNRVFGLSIGYQIF